MPRPNFVTNEDISNWSEMIDNDERIPAGLAQSPIIREVCYAGLWMQEELVKLNCPDEWINRIQFTAGKLSFGRDAWDVHINMVERFKNNELKFEDDPTVDVN